MDTVQELIDRSPQLKSLPIVLAKLNELIADPRSSVDDFAKVISGDASLAGRLLKLVNSALFGLPSQVDTINRAVGLVGTREIRNLALASSAARIIDGMPTDIVNMAQFWRDSIYCALYAKYLGKTAKIRESERLFAAGLLHDVGTIILCVVLPDDMRQVIEKERLGDQPLYAIEQDRFGFNHAQVAGELLKTWQLPDSLYEPVNHCLTPDQAIDHRQETVILYLADQLARAHGDPAEVQKITDDEVMWQRAGVSPSVWEAVSQDVEERFELTRKLMLG